MHLEKSQQSLMTASSEKAKWILPVSDLYSKANILAKRSILQAEEVVKR